MAGTDRVDSTQAPLAAPRNPLIGFLTLGWWGLPSWLLCRPHLPAP